MKKIWKQLQRNIFFKMVIVSIIIVVLIQININRLSKDDVIDIGRGVKHIIEEIKK